MSHILSCLSLHILAYTFAYSCLSAYSFMLWSSGSLGREIHEGQDKETWLGRSKWWSGWASNRYRIIWTRDLLINETGLYGSQRYGGIALVPGVLPWMDSFMFFRKDRLEWMGGGAAFCEKTVGIYRKQVHFSGHVTESLDNFGQAFWSQWI